MVAIEFNRVAVPVAVALFFVLGMVWPTLRLKMRTGIGAVVVHRPANPFQRVIGFAMAVFMAAVLMWGLLCAALEPSRLYVWSLPSAVSWAGWSITSVGFLLVLAAQAQMGLSWRIGIDTNRTELVTHGLFRVVRNPIFAGMFFAILGLVITMPSPWTVMGLLNYALLVSLQVRLEEQHLATTHGPSYMEYAARVGRFVPFFGRLQSNVYLAAPATR